MIIFSGMLTKAQEVNSKKMLTRIGNIEVELDALNKSVTITKQGKVILDINCDDWILCNLFIATTYEVIYSGYDGAIDPNETLIPLGNTIEKGIPVFKLPSYDNEIIGFVKGIAGASGGGSQTLYLIDIQTGKHITITSGDQYEPEWIEDSGKLGFKISHTTKNSGREFSVFHTDTYYFNPENFSFDQD